jgi:hypothetical protein
MHEQEISSKENAMKTIKATIRNRRIDVPAPNEMPDGTEVTVTIESSASNEAGPMSPEEIARVLAAMQQLQPLEIPDDVADDLDAWERKVNQYGIDRGERGLEEVFP